jgi:hypothetical protein
METAKVAYEAYANARDWVSFNGDPLPEWDSQAENIKNAWRAAAEAVKREQPSNEVHYHFHTPSVASGGYVPSAFPPYAVWR